MGACKFCNGWGVEYVDGTSLRFKCQDCNGTGKIPECDECGIEYNGEYCEECYAPCKECGAVTLTDALENGRCADCAEEQQPREKCPKCNVEMSVWCRDIFDYSTNRQYPDVPHWHCPKCGNRFPYVR